MFRFSIGGFCERASLPWESAWFWCVHYAIPLFTSISYGEVSVLLSSCMFVNAPICIILNFFIRVYGLRFTLALSFAFVDIVA